MRILAFAEAWARRGGYGMIILNARIGAEAFYKKHGHATEGEPFDENTIPHIRMTKRIFGRETHELGGWRQGAEFHPAGRRRRQGLAERSNEGRNSAENKLILGSGYAEGTETGARARGKLVQ